MPGNRLRLLLFIMLLALALPATVLAGTITEPFTGITIVTPNHYGSCTATGDTITISNLNGFQLLGQVILTYVLDGPDQVVSVFPVNHTGPTDFQLFVPYPPVSEWPSNEIHVDIQIEVKLNGNFVYRPDGSQVVLGPGSDWDVFCNRTPPPTTPPPTTPPPTTPPPTTPPPPGDEGCTPGYWKQEQHFDSYPAPYTPNTLFSSVFGVGPSIPLKDAAALEGGGENALVRHATAALLNAASGFYPFTVTEVIQAVQAAYASNDFETAKDIFDDANNLGCPLD